MNDENYLLEELDKRITAIELQLDELKKQMECDERRLMTVLKMIMYPSALRRE